MSNTADTPDTLHHITAGSITGARMTDTPRHSSATGYGSKIPTGYMLEAGGKWRRVYVINYGNAGSTYVLISGARHYLSPGVGLILETVRDGGTLEGARELMAAWPVWMKESEGLPAYAEGSPAAIAARLEELRAALDAENISTGELIELQGLAAHIQPGDVQLLEAAGVPEFPEDDDAPALEPGDTFTTPDGQQLLVQFVTPTEGGRKLDGRWIAEDGSIEALATYYLQDDAPALQIQRPADTPLQRRIAAGHLQRTGHALDAVQVSSDGLLWTPVRRCCGENVPAAVATWQDMTPGPDEPARLAYLEAIADGMEESEALQAAGVLEPVPALEELRGITGSAVKSRFPRLPHDTAYLLASVLEARQDRWAVALLERHGYTPEGGAK